jgi:diguanylate cyclase (GGDEF)-like protein
MGELDHNVFARGTATLCAIPPRVAAPERSILRRLLIRAEAAAPFAAAGLVLGSGACGVARALGYAAPAGPLAEAPPAASLLVAGAGAGLLLCAWDRWRAQTLLRDAQVEAARARSQRDVAVQQARRMRGQTEGLALMREIHRATAMPVREERLRRILTLLADLFEAREVTLLVTQSGAECRGTEPRGAPANALCPAAWLRMTSKEEIFACFEEEQSGGSGRALPANAPSASLCVTPESAAIAREGCHLYVVGTLDHDGDPVARVQWRRGPNAEQDLLTQLGPAEIIENALLRLHASLRGSAAAALALEKGRTVCAEERTGAGRAPAMYVPLLADQRALGVLRLRRAGGEHAGSEGEALEELLAESAKHVALALKKDDDDRKAITDGLTALYIKRHFLTVLAQMREEAAVSETPFCLVMGDIDHFKRVNDTHGHLSGDLILKGVAAVIRKGLRSGDMAFRYGGEELAVLLPKTNLATARQTAERLRTGVQASSFCGDKGQPVQVTLSLGVAQFEARLSGDTLISRADQALYASKQNGRNQCTVWTDEGRNSEPRP